MNKLERKITRDMDWFAEEEYPWRWQLERLREHLNKVETTRAQHRIIEQGIETAERAGEAIEATCTSDDLNLYTQMLVRIVNDFWRAKLPALEKASVSDSQSRRTKGKPRPKRQGTLRKIVEELALTDFRDVETAWKESSVVTVEGNSVVLDYRKQSIKPFRAGNKSWNSGAVRTAVSKFKNRISVTG